MASFWKIVNKVIREANVLLLVLDSRFVKETRHSEVESKVKKQGKKLIYVLNKCDLVDKSKLEKLKKTLKSCVFISSIKHYGITKLREKIMVEASKINKQAQKKEKIKPKLEKVLVGVLGYPNTGKSSLINAMKGRKSAPSSSTSGYTKSVQKIRSRQIIFLDTPGVIPADEAKHQKKDRKDKDNKHSKQKNSAHAIISAVDPNKVKDPDLVVLKILEKYPGVIEKHFAVKPSKDPEKTLENIAIKKNYLMKGGKPDINRVSKEILIRWQKGLIN